MRLGWFLSSALLMGVAGVAAVAEAEVVAAAAEAAVVVAAVVAAVVVATDITAHLGGRLTVNWHWRLIGLL